MKKTDDTGNARFNTYSIVGCDPAAGELGVAVSSKFLAAGAVVPWARADAGAVATQSLANLEFGTKGLALMAAGKSAPEVLKEMTASDPGLDERQVGLVDKHGGSATFTGKKCYDWAGGIAGPNFACQGNILVSEQTVKAMAEAFQQTEGDLAERLMRALLAGDEAGGDSRSKQSAGLLVVKEGGGYGGVTDKYMDLRVDDHKEPVRELQRLHQLHQLYFKKSPPEDILTIKGALKEELTSMLTLFGYLKKEAKPDDAALFAALRSYQLIENFDERIQEPGYVDKKVVEYMKNMAG